MADVGETLACTQGAADGSIPAELQAQARQILKRLLVTTILVKPNEPGDSELGAYTRFEGLLMGGLNHGKVTLYQWEGEPGGFFRDPTLAAIRPVGGPFSRLYFIDLPSGRAVDLGRIGKGELVVVSPSSSGPQCSSAR